MHESIATAICRTLESLNVVDTNGEAANVVDVIDRLARYVGRVANSITPPVAGGTDANGGHVESLTEAVMGVTQSTSNIASAISEVACSLQNIADEIAKG